ncbi:MAG: hypothetical protein GC178_09285, partial [Flavobacteriales bacterium]|nr:hypothetical protein [Flavobacteriales bacterium]
MKYLISGGLLWLMSVACLAQPYGDSKFKQKFNKADALVYDGAYMDALPLLEELYASDSMNANVNHLLGICYLMGKKDHALAIKRLESATRDVASPGTYEEGNWKEKRAPGITYYYLGKAYHHKNQFDRAVSNYYNYRSFIELDDVETYNQVRQQIQYAENAMELTKHPVGVKITNMGPTVNSKYPDYCPIVTADGRTLIFTSRREGGTGGLVDDNGNYYDDIYISTRQSGTQWSAPKSIGSNINTPGHDAAIGLSPDGQLLFIYKDDNGDGNIYYSTKNGGDWSKPEPMGSDINSKSWETHATVNATQDMLIFVSNRSEGGYGGRDLWYCKKLPNGEWALAQNMGSVVNSQYEEDSPFISADGKTLIFSSMGHTSMGGFDIFRSEFEDGAWTVPENIGYPINTSEDDVFFILAPDGRTGYYSSDKDGGFGGTDLYMLRLEAKKSDAMAVARGNMKVPAMAYADISAKITVTDEGGANIGTYRPNPSTGFFVLILRPGETYTITYEADGYEPIVAKLPISQDESYEEYDGVLELEEVVFGENILALQDETKKLEEEAALAAQRAADEERLAAEAEERAKQQAEAEALAKQKEEERKKAEALAAKEKEEAEAELASEEERAKQAELERRKAEAKARFEAIQAQAAKEAAEKEASEQAEETAQTENAEAELAAKQAEETPQAKAAEEARLKAEKESKAQAEKAAAELAAKKAEEAAQAKAAEEARLKAEQESKAQAEKAAAELAAKKAEEAAQAKAAEEARLKAEQESKAQAEKAAAELAAKQAEEAARAKAAEEARLK